MKYAEWILEHQKYLKSDKWQLIRDKVLARDSETCQKCGKCGWQVHHITYARWQNEQLEDLITLCDDCHHLEHLARKKAKQANSAPKRVIPPPPRQPTTKSKSRRRKVDSFIEKILKGKEFARFDKGTRKLLLPHPTEILDHFGFRGNSYQEKFNDITEKWFNKFDLVQKLRTMGPVFERYRRSKCN